MTSKSYKILKGIFAGYLGFIILSIISFVIIVDKPFDELVSNLAVVISLATAIVISLLTMFFLIFSHSKSDSK